jgi:hypothetical protein
LDSELNEQQEIINFERRKIADILLLGLENLNVINFGRSTLGDQAVNGSNCSLDYDYYLGRKDIVYATTTEIKRLQGAPADFPKLPIVPEGTLGMCSIDCPPNSTDGGTIWDAIVPAEEERLPNLAADALVRVRFSTGMGNDTPSLNFKDVNLVGYLNKTSGVYLTLENDLTQGVESTKAYVQMDIPSGTTLQWFASNDGGATWEAMTIQGNSGGNSRADIQSFRHQRDLPASMQVHKPVAVKSVRSEQKTFQINKRSYAVNSTPLKATTQMEAIVENTRNVTCG